LKVIDGDTIKFDSQTIRLAGIDCPESHKKLIHYLVADKIALNQYHWGKLAKEKTTELLDNTQPLSLVVTGEDKYKRSIGSIILSSGSDLGVELVLLGLARVYPAYVNFCSNRLELKEAEKIAKETGSGFWGKENPLLLEPWLFRKRL